MGQYRLLKLGEQIRGEIANMILRAEIKDPRVSNFLTINRVEVAKDLAHAKVYVSTFMSESELNRGVQGLTSAAGFIQSTIAKKLTIRQFPHLHFVADTSIRDGYEMAKKLEDLVKSDAEKSAAAQASGSPEDYTCDDRSKRNNSLRQKAWRHKLFRLGKNQENSWHKKSRPHGNLGLVRARPSCSLRRKPYPLGRTYHRL